MLKSRIRLIDYTQKHRRSIGVHALICPKLYDVFVYFQENCNFGSYNVCAFFFSLNGNRLISVMCIK